MADRPTVARQHGEHVLYDSRHGYHVTLSREDLACLAAQITQQLYVDIICDGVIPAQSPEPSIAAQPTV